jgi:hypothetical protein
MERCIPWGDTYQDVFLPPLLEDVHLTLRLASTTNDVMFSPGDYLTAAFYDFWPYTGVWGPRTFALVAVDNTRYHFGDAAPAHAAPVMVASSTLDFDGPNARLTVRWDAARDADTVDDQLTYEVNLSPAGGVLDDALWESVGRSYAAARTVGAGDAFTIGIRARDDFGLASEPLLLNWEYPPAEAAPVE